MKQLELFEPGLQPIRRWLTEWTPEERAKKIPRPERAEGKTPAEPAGGGFPGQAASFSGGISESSGQIERQSERKC